MVALIMLTVFFAYRKFMIMHDFVIIDDTELEAESDI